MLVVKALLQMGWIKSPPYFCTVSQTGLDVAKQYVDNPVESLEPHKFVKLNELNPWFDELPQEDSLENPFNYMLDMYMDDNIVFGHTKEPGSTTSCYQRCYDRHS